ncbi:MAG: carbamoyltransferase HypF, partial [Candidatus Woesearchaeota archaeon]
MTYIIKVTGVVQGVGFRPFVCNEANKRKIFGTVKNVGDGVEIVTNDKTEMLDILKRSPKLSRIDSVVVSKIENKKFSKFLILESSGTGYSEIPSDIFMCEDCLKEFLDENNKRFYHHPFISCTNCGPRFSIAFKSPYDRINTSMSEFEMCSECKKEYSDLKNRRYHAQTICCNNCGPKLKFYNEGKIISDYFDSSKLIVDVVNLLKKGEIVAIKGIGGFHLVCLTKFANNLRKITGRQNKPYALMVKDFNMAKKYVVLSDVEKDILESSKRPILVLNKKNELKNNVILNCVSELDSLGIMLPYSGLHYLLFEYLDEPLVCTSSNYPDQPITFEKDQQFSKYVLAHDRKIINRIDDSVIKVIDDNSLFLRRSRGFVPSPVIVKNFKNFKNSNKTSNVKLNKKTNDVILALGAEMHNVISLYVDGKIYQSQYLGTLSNYDSYINFKKTILIFLKMLNVKPDVVLCDLHPTYNSSKFAEEFAKENNISFVKIQHHLSHAYSVSLEHDLSDFVSIVCDGLGFGEDSNIWGGEVFYNNKRIGHLEEHEQIGGDLANKDPSRMIFSIMKKVLSKKDFEKFMLKYVDTKKFNLLDKQLISKINCPLTSSTGRIFDSVSFMLGFYDSMTYEGRGAMILEAKSTVPFDVEPVIKDGVLMTTFLFKFIYDNLNKNNSDKNESRLAATAQLYVAKGLFMIAENYIKRIKKKVPVVFSGGCTYN